MSSEYTEAKQCRATIEIPNGEYVSPCHKPRNHDGQHEGYCLGSRAVWTEDDVEAAPSATRAVGRGE